MRDDIQFNIEFCKEVQLYSNLYDYLRSDYCNRSAQDHAWEKIAQKFTANAIDCKERWKNIRGSYSKYKAKLHIKSGCGAKRIKEYYLTPHLLFLDPFLKTRKSKGTMIDEAIETLIEEEADASECEDYNDNEEVLSPDNSLSIRSSHSSAPSSSTSVDNESTNIMKVPEIPGTKGNRKNSISTTSINDVNQQAYQYLKKKQRLLKIQNPKTIDPPDPDLAFLQSVLPDMKSMNSSQKRHFKMGILNLAEQILSVTTPQVPTPIAETSLSYPQDALNSNLRTKN